MRGRLPTKLKPPRTRDHWNAMTAPPLNPPLGNREHLTRDEFLRRREAIPDLYRAKSIYGVVSKPSSHLSTTFA